MNSCSAMTVSKISLMRIFSSTPFVPQNLDFLLTGKEIPAVRRGQSNGKEQLNGWPCMHLMSSYLTAVLLRSVILRQDDWYRSSQGTTFVASGMVELSMAALQLYPQKEPKTR
jgi:hypothetical protein